MTRRAKLRSSNDLGKCSCVHEHPLSVDGVTVKLALNLHCNFRYSIDHNAEGDALFTIDVDSGLITTTRSLDREEVAWHNITVMASEIDNPNLVSYVPVTVQVLDVNDNAPYIATDSALVVCEGSKAGQVIQTIRATDKDNFANGRFTFALPERLPASENKPLLSLTDSSASVLARRQGFSQAEQELYQLPVVVWDGGEPVLSSTSTLTLRVCPCQRGARTPVCRAQAFLSSAGLSTGALIAILLCVLILLVIVVLFAALKRQKKKEPLIISKEDVRDNVVSYNDEGGGEEDTQAFDIGALRHPEVMEESKLRRDILPSESLYPPPPLRRTAVPSRENADVRDFINQRVQENDGNPTAPPYDSLATYAYEGNGSVAESLSSLGSVSSEGEQDYNYLSEWGPRFRKLADMYGGEDSDWDS
ncbi:cadherin-6-like [Puntigrus tetrazona]|uniref:cadherin-6-like n=1 Tax=Puntigrus tetrazona TaxID=1606681 RepID=UPI001C89D1C1|nr:cadherin-6-like [Puntigrus tetrazona]